MNILLVEPAKAASTIGGEDVFLFEPLALESAIMLDAEKTLDAPYRRLESDILIQFTPGVLRARLSNR